MRAGQKYVWPALFALERGRRGINVDYCCLAHAKQPFLPLVICLTTDTMLFAPCQYALPTVSTFCDPFGPYRQFVLLI